VSGSRPSFSRSRSWKASACSRAASPRLHPDRDPGRGFHGPLDPPGGKPRATQGLTEGDGFRAPPAPSRGPRRGSRESPR
jgi:hypothetical protein